MIRSFITPCLVAIVGLTLTGTAQAQHGRHHGHNQGPRHGQKLHFNPPSQFVHVQPPVFATPQLIDCSPELGFFGRINRQGMLVTRVIPGTEAHFLGLVPGDTILRADRRRISCEQDWRQALQRAGRTMNLQVQRTCGRTQMLQARLRGAHNHPFSVQPPQFHLQDYPQAMPGPAHWGRGHSSYGAGFPRQNSTGYHLGMQNNGVSFGISFNN